MKIPEKIDSKINVNYDDIYQVACETYKQCNLILKCKEEMLDYLSMMPDKTKEDALLTKKIKRELCLIEKYLVEGRKISSDNLELLFDYSDKKKDS